MPLLASAGHSARAFLIDPRVAGMVCKGVIPSYGSSRDLYTLLRSAGDRVSTHPRIGIFLCECGGEISNRIDLGKIAERVRSLTGVADLATQPFWCSPGGLAELGRRVTDGSLERVVVAGCSPRSHGNLLRDALGQVGLNRNFVQIVNLREHCARVHPDQTEAATEKAHRLLKVGLAAARQAERIETIEADVNPEVAVVGGGVAGTTAALSLARREVTVHLIEQAPTLGGYLNHLAKLYPRHADAGEFVRARVQQIQKSDPITVHLNSRVTEIRGHTGAFEIVMEQGAEQKSIAAGAVIVATGAEEPAPEGRGERTLSLTDLESRLRTGDVLPARIVFVLSAEGPTPGNPASVAVIAQAALECAGAIRERHGEVALTVLFRDFPAGAKEAVQALAAGGVRFVRYSPERPPVVSNLGVEVEAFGNGKRESIEADLVVQATGLAPSGGTRRLGEGPLLWQDEDGFLLEPHLRLRSEEVLDRGVFVAGTAHGPADIPTSMAQAFGAAAAALALIRTGKIVKHALVAEVVEDLCRGCGRCEEVCPFGAAELVLRENGVKKSQVDRVLCVGCGFCASECISGAIRLPFLTDRQLRSMVTAAALEG